MVRKWYYCGMTHSDHVKLIEKAIYRKDGAWADLGSGTGSFTLALSDILGQTGVIYSVDKNKSSLNKQKATFSKHFPVQKIIFKHQDFTKDLKLPKLDGIIMANSLHFLKDKVPFLASLRRLLKPDGRLVFVEYNSDIGNIWVPYPASFHSLSRVCTKAGYDKATLTGRIASSFLREIYACFTISARAWNKREKVI